jgi:hypothetical protein
MRTYTSNDAFLKPKPQKKYITTMNWGSNVMQPALESKKLSKKNSVTISFRRNNRQSKTIKVSRP